MTSKRIPCTRCETMILEVTAEYNNGICGICKRKDRTRPQRLELAKKAHVQHNRESFIISFFCIGTSLGLLALLYWLSFGLLFWILFIPIALVVYGLLALGFGCIYLSIQDLRKTDEELLDD